MSTQAKKPAVAANTDAKPVNSRMAKLYGSRFPHLVSSPPLNDPITEVDGSGTKIKLSSVPRSTHFAIDAGSGSGTCSFRGVVMGGVNSRAFNTGKGGSMGMYSMLICITSDVPRPDDVYDHDKKKIELPSTLVYAEQQLRIATADQIRRDIEDPHALQVIGRGKPPKIPGVKTEPRAKILRPDITGSACLGAFISITVNSQKVDPPGEPEYGAEYEFTGVTYKAEQGENKLESGGKDNSHVIFENWEAAAAKRNCRFWDDGNFARHNELAAILFGIGPMRGASLPVPIREPGFDLDKEMRLAQEAKKKGAAVGDAAHAASLTELYGAEAGDEEGATEGGVEREETALMSLSDKEKNELAKRALTKKSRRDFANAAWVVPATNTTSPIFAEYMEAHGIPYKEWMVVGFNAAGEPQFEPCHDPTARQNFFMNATPENVQVDKDRKPEIVFVDPRPGTQVDGKALRLCPVANLRWQCTQPLPNKALPGEPLDPATKQPVRDGRTTQRIDVHVRNSSHSLHAYGIQDPLTMGLIVPSLVAVTPGVNICYPTNQLDVLEKMPLNPADDNLPLYKLSGCVVGVNRNKDGTTTKKDVPSFFLDNVQGIINAGLPITHEAAMRLYKWAAKAFEKNPLCKVAADGNMTGSAYKKKEFYASTTQLVGVPIINCWENQINYAEEGGRGDWCAYVVSTFVQKPSRYDTEMNALYEALRGAKKPMDSARKFFGKLIVDIAEKKARLGATESVLANSSPEDVIANSKAVKEYAAELAKEAGLAAFPFDPLRMNVVFGPLHAQGQEPDYSPETGLPFHCAMFGVSTTYLEKRHMDKYIGDDFFQDWIVPRLHAGYKAAVDKIKTGEPSYKDYRRKVDASHAQDEEKSRKLKAREPPAPKPKAITAEAGAEVAASGKPAAVAKPTAKAAPKVAAKPSAAAAEKPAVPKGNEVPDVEQQQLKKVKTASKPTVAVEHSMIDVVPAAAGVRNVFEEAIEEEHYDDDDDDAQTFA